MIQHLIDFEGRFNDNCRSHVKPSSRELMILNFEIDYEPVDVTRSPQIQVWAQGGFDALQQNNGREAEICFKKCIEAGEDAPDLWNNLAAAFAMQGRDAEMHELQRTIHAKWPEYFFGRIYMANTATLEGRFNDAEQILRPMLTQQRFHITEFRAMATAQIQLEMQQHRLDAAQSWLDMWKSVEPDHDNFKELQQRINLASISQRLLAWSADQRR